MSDLMDELRKALPPTPNDAGPDLWIRMEARLAEREALRFQTMRFHWWFDWALAVAIALWFALFPQSILGFFYHL